VAVMNVETGHELPLRGRRGSAAARTYPLAALVENRTSWLCFPNSPPIGIVGAASLSPGMV